MTHHHDDSGPTDYGLLAEFDSAEALLNAARQAYDQGYRKIDGYSSVPVDGLAEAMGMKRNLVAPVVFLGGLGGGLGGFLLQWFASVVHYPFDIGGRPFNSWPAFIPITFELTVLGAAACATFGMFAMNGLPKPYHSLFNDPTFAIKASTDGYFFCIESADPKFDPAATLAFLEGLRPLTVRTVER